MLCLRRFLHNGRTTTTLQPVGPTSPDPDMSIDRTAIRTASENVSCATDLDDVRCQLENTAKMLDRATDEDAARSTKDGTMEQEVLDLYYLLRTVAKTPD